eukprot:CAMPEP_0196226628 /NCGR_PEP_ID=MMETSP0912-20130531/50499_1 /TAXON_ID=49265 /ORGANISM="Thalassiosira rotula, Strain GSO102" /LENGTH=872 /DNA_ID=CAMNT_0041506137 /DNA_START=459 /DNA_END=3079 /DNA_ORIENTATION=+
MDFACTWRSYFKQQAYHLGIALESNGNDASGGYAYKDMVDIWKAANATRSDLIGQWWATETTYVSLLGTDSELIKITLPVATESCIEARASYDRCDENATPSEEHGAKEGACGEKPIGLRNVVVGNLQTNIEQNKNLVAAMSPAYDFVNNFDLTELQIYQLLEGRQRRGIDSNKNIDFRHATCKWLADNWDFVARLVPQSHPRTFTEDPLLAAPITITALVISALALAVTSAAAFLISGVPRCQSISTRRLAFRKTAQIEFVRMLLLGQFFIPLGALLLACAPSEGRCIASVWLINVGYTLVLVPTLVRVSALIKVLQAGKKFRRVAVDKKKLVKTSVGISGIAAVFCAIWTGLDPMKPQEQLILTDETNDLGETIVGVSYYCKSESDAWFWIVFFWQGLLLASGSALAFQLRSAPKIVNDSNKLSFMLYSSFMFLVFRLALLVFSRSLLDDSVTKISLQMIESIFWSIDSIVNIFIYFYKVFLKDENSKEQARPGKFGYNNGQATPLLQQEEEETFESIQGHHPGQSRSSEGLEDDKIEIVEGEHITKRERTLLFLNLISLYQRRERSSTTHRRFSMSKDRIKYSEKTSPCEGRCIASVWLINVGYTLVLVPTLVRVSALIKVLQAGKKFRRVAVDKKKLVKTSVGISGIAAVFCAIWTGLDPMKPQEQLILTDETNDLGETIVGVSYYCKSESDAWFWIVFFWQGLLLASGSALAFQLRSAPKIVNDSNKLSFMLYSSFMFLVFRLALLVFSRSLLDDSVTKISLQMIESIFWSIDSIVNIFIYFYKFFLKDENSKEQARPGKFGYNNGQATRNLQPSTAVEREEEKVKETEISLTRCSACGSIQEHHPVKSRSSEESKDDEDRFYECTT